MTRQEFIINTLKPYFEDTGKLAYRELIIPVYGPGGIEIKYRCEYISTNGNKCAAGIHMNAGPWQEEETDIQNILAIYSPEEVFQKEAFEQNLSIAQWGTIQRVHDMVVDYLHSGGRKSLRYSISNCEKTCNVNLSELLTTKIFEK